MKLRKSLKRWLIPVLGGTMVVLSLPTPAHATSSNGCFYDPQQVACRPSFYRYATIKCAGIFGIYYARATYTKYVAFAPKCVYNYYGYSLSASAFTGLCAYTYSVMKCGVTTKTVETIGWTTASCEGSCPRE